MRKLSRVKLHWGFARFLMWEFRWPLGVFSSLVLVGGALLKLGYHHRPLPYLEACYAVFTLIFLESNLDFPEELYLQPLFFLLPIIGLGALADSVVRLAYLTFTKKSKLPEWQIMVASMYHQHVVVVGVGRVGYRIVKGLLALHENVVAIERRSDSLIVEELVEAGVPIIKGDGRQRRTLEHAGVAHAKAVILATEDDLANLDAALTARDIQPGIRLVLRLFDDTLASKVAGAFSMPVISTGQVAAPAFIAAATGRKVYHEFELAGNPVHLTDVTVHPGGGLVNLTIGQLQADKHVNVVMHSGPSGVNVNPDHDVVLAPNDTMLVIAPLDCLRGLESANGRGGESVDRGP